MHLGYWLDVLSNENRMPYQRHQGLRLWRVAWLE